MTNEIETEFLVESNAIERVYDDDSLTQAIHAWEYLKLQDKLSIGVILKTHKILMLNQNLKPDEKGYFRKVPIWVSGREGINYLRIEDVLEQWVVNANDVARNGKNNPDFFLENLIKAHHVEYERIHPFRDGNGRTGRMFMNWERLKVGLPILVIHEGEEQKNYYSWFR